jgi:FkbM family methyltransferase
MLFIRILKKLGFYKKLNLTFSTTINNVRFSIPVIQGIGEGHLSPSEEWKIPLISKLTKLKKGLFIDVGVNIGHTLLKLRSVDPDYKYIGFEPNASCVNYLKDLISVNHFKNTSVIPVALGSKDELLALNFHVGGDEESASLISDFRPNQAVVQKEFVPVFSYETIRPTLFTDQVSIIKIDVEGFELEVIKGLSTLINSDKPYIICEILPTYSTDNKTRVDRQEEITSRLKKEGYVILRILKDATLHKINDIEIHSDIDLCYYLFVHESNLTTVSGIFEIK